MTDNKATGGRPISATIAQRVIWFLILVIGLMTLARYGYRIGGEYFAVAAMIYLSSKKVRKNA